MTDELKLPSHVELCCESIDMRKGQVGLLGVLEQLGKEFQSDIRTCLLHGVNPRHYLVDVLEQISRSKGTIEDFSDFTPRLWKENNTQQWTQPLAKAA